MTENGRKKERENEREAYSSPFGGRMTTNGKTAMISTLVDGCARNAASLKTV